MTSLQQIIEEMFQSWIQNAEQLLNAAQSQQFNNFNDPRILMVFFYARALRDYRAIHLLWTKGFGTESWVIGRPMIELLLQAALLRQDPKKHAEAFFEHGKVKRYATFKQAAELAQKGLTVVPANVKFDLASPAALKLRKYYDAHKHKFMKDKKRERLWDNWWCGSIAKLADLVKTDSVYGQYLYDQYHFAYRNDSQYVHSGEVTVVDYIEPHGDSFIIRDPEPEGEPSVPMHLTQRLVLMGIFLNEICKLGFDQPLQKDWNDSIAAFAAGAEVSPSGAST